MLTSCARRPQIGWDHFGRKATTKASLTEGRDSCLKMSPTSGNWMKRQPVLILQRVADRGDRIHSEREGTARKYGAHTYRFGASHPQCDPPPARMEAAKENQELCLSSAARRPERPKLSDLDCNSTRRRMFGYRTPLPRPCRVMGLSAWGVASLVFARAQSRYATPSSGPDNRGDGVGLAICARGIEPHDRSMGHLGDACHRYRWKFCDRSIAPGDD